LDAPEACHLLSSSETVIGDDFLILSRLNKLFDVLPMKIAINNDLQRPPTPLNSKILITKIENFKFNFIKFFFLDHFSGQTKKYSDLNEFCSNMLNSKIPKPVSKVTTLYKLVYSTLS
jgi:hypothetical protein